MEEAVFRLFGQWEYEDEEILAGIRQLIGTWGDAVYPELLRQLAGKEFDRITAQQHWQKAVNLQKILRSRKGVRFGLRPVLLHYLHQVAMEIRDPRIIEAEQLETIRKAAVTDGLTGLFQQIYFKGVLEKEIAKLRRSMGCHLAVLMLDLDHFKQYNDRCGHLAGDLALRLVADRLRENTREEDVAARYGGEEFAIFLPNTDRRQAYKIAERIRTAIEQTAFPDQELLDSGNLTISGGVAIYPDDAVTAEGLIDHADRQLYQAKDRRNAIHPASRERRRYFRKKVRSILEFATEKDTSSFHPALTQDVSAHGLNLGASLHFEQGMSVLLRFTQPFWAKSQQIKAVVRHIRQDREGMVFVGLEFDKAVADFGFSSQRSASPLCSPSPAGG